MPLRQKQEGIFDVSTNLLAKPQKKVPLPNRNSYVDYDPYKLHLVIPSHLCCQVSKAVNALLDEATENFIITGYKVINYNRLVHPAKREQQVPYTIYLQEEYTAENADQVLTLCKKIEALLVTNAIPTVDPGHYLYNSECTLGRYFSFRAANTQQNMDAQIFKYIAGTDLTTAAELKETGLHSAYYNHLKKGLAADEEKVESNPFLAAPASLQAIPENQTDCVEEHGEEAGMSEANFQQLPISPRRN